MKILLIGERGQLARELIRTCMPLGEVVPVDYPQFDISNPAQIQETIAAVRPEMVINASAYTDVDKAESEPDKAMAVNADGPGWLAKSCAQQRIPLIHYSTDFVFDGTKKTPYVESDAPHPISVYGLSKWKGEQAVQNETKAALIFRLAWLYSMHGNNFVTKFLEWARKQETLRIVDDQIGNPTWARFTAEATAALLAQSLVSGKPLYDWFAEKNGIYHLTSGGQASRYEWACEIWQHIQNQEQYRVKEILSAKTSDFPTTARRPAYSPLDCEKFEVAFGLHVPIWKEQLANCLFFIR